MKERFTLRPKEHSVLVKQTSKWGQAIAISLMSIGGIIFSTAYIYKIDEIITVPGILTPADGGVAVKSSMSGTLKGMEVKEGQEIKKGKIVAKFDLQREREEQNRLETEIRFEKKKLSQQLNSNKLRIKNKESRLRVTEELLERLTPLSQVGALSEVKILQQEERIASIKNEILQLQSEKDNLITRSEALIKANESKLKQVQLILDQGIIKSPINGIVFNVKPDNDSYVTTKAEILMEIIPNDGLAASLKVSNRDIGFMRKGQKVKVRVDSYPFTEYGELKGQIKSIGADALESKNRSNSYYFPVKIQLENDELETKKGFSIPLQAGMTVTANIKLRERRLIEIVSDMFVNQQESIERLRKP